MFTLHKNVRQPSNALTNLYQLSQSQKYIIFATINRILTTLLRIISRTIWTHSLIQPVTTRENEQCGYTSSRDRFSFDCNTKTIRLVSQMYKGVILKLPRAKVNFNMYWSYGVLFLLPTNTGHVTVAYYCALVNETQTNKTGKIHCI